MSRAIYYFSTGSRYSYLSMSQIPGIEKRYGIQFTWVPVNGKRIRALRGADPFQGPPQSGQYDWDYRERDAKAWAEHYHIEFNEPRDVEFDVELLLRAVIAAGRQQDMRPFAWALAQAVFAHQRWPLDQAVIQSVAQGCDLDVPRLLEECASGEVQDELERNCATAVAQGVFGTPTVLLDDQLFWGNDRLVLLRSALQTRQAGDRVIQATGLDHVVLRSNQPEALVRFYQDLLGVEVERQVEDFLWQLRVGDSLLDILRIKQTTSGANMDHFCLRVAHYNEADLLAHLAGFNVEARVAGNIYGAQGFGPSIYFIDPQGNQVELKQLK